MPKTIKHIDRALVMKLKGFFDEEKMLNGPVIPFNKVFARLSYATGISLGSIRYIVKEHKSPRIKPPKKPKIPFPKLDISESDLEDIKQFIHNKYTEESKKIPPIRKLLLILKEECNYKGGRESLRILLHKLGFQYKTKLKQKISTEIKKLDMPKSSQVKIEYKEPNGSRTVTNLNVMDHTYSTQQTLPTGHHFMASSSSTYYMPTMQNSHDIIPPINNVYIRAPGDCYNNCYDNI